MKTSPNTHRQRAFTFKELVVVIAAVAVLAGVVLPWLRAAEFKAKRISCISRLKQIGLGARIWAGDYGTTNAVEAYPARVSTNAGGAREWVLLGQVWTALQMMSNELNTPKILVCPTDTRSEATGFTGLRNTNVSYFIGPDAEANQPEGLFTGDRNLAAAGRPLPPGLVTLTTNQPVGWTRAQHRGAGNLGFADGSVGQISNARLQELLASQPGGTNRVVIP